MQCNLSMVLPCICLETALCLWCGAFLGKRQWFIIKGVLLGFVLTAPIVLWWADVFERLVDRPAVRLAKWLYARGTRERM